MFTRLSRAFAHRPLRAELRTSLVALIALIALASAAASVPVSAQTAGEPVGEPTRVALTRAADSLHAFAADPKRDSGDRDRALAAEAGVRDRLTNGDFLVGDRVVIAVMGQPTLTDTFTVRQNREIYFASLPPLSLAGVLRSEAGARITNFVAQYIKSPVVTVVPLLRLSVEGSVVRPGFYSVPSDALVSDVIMRAGGPAADSDMGKTVVKRDGYLYWGTAFFSPKLYGGATVDALGLRSGDQIVVGTTKKTSASTVVQIALSSVTVLSMLIALKHR